MFDEFDEDNTKTHLVIPSELTPCHSFHSFKIKRPLEKRWISFFDGLYHSRAKLYFCVHPTIYTNFLRTLKFE